MSTTQPSALYQEHVLLGASFDEAEAQLSARVLSYLGEKDARLSADEAMLCDLTGSCYLLAEGAYASGFASAAFAGSEAQVGECAFSACLTGDGSVVSVPLLLRTGSDELVVLDVSPRRDVLGGWLSFLRAVDAQGVRPYESVSLEDAHGTLVPLLLAGGGATRVLTDYLGEGSALPKAGTVAQLMLDKIGALVANVAGSGLGAGAYVVFVPVPYARTLWRSFLSFTEVVPVGHARLEEELENALPWGSLLRSSDQIRAERQQLVDWGIVRGDDGFVGARALRGEA